MNFVFYNILKKVVSDLIYKEGLGEPFRYRIKRKFLEKIKNHG